MRNPEVSWPKLLALAEQQLVEGVVADTLFSYFHRSDEPQGADWRESIGLDSEQHLVWMGCLELEKSRNQAHLRAAQQLSQLWASKGLQCYLLKGFSYATMYPNPLLRHGDDIDTFILSGPDGMGTEEAWNLANKLVEESGVEVNRDFYKNSSFDYQRTKVENHRFCSAVRGYEGKKRYERFLQSIIADKHNVKVLGTELLMPSPLFNALFFMSHAQVHFLMEGGIRLRSVCDWAAMLRYYRADGSNPAAKARCEAFWKAFLDGCEQYGLSCFALPMSKVAERVCGVTLPFECDVDERLCDKLLDDILSPKNRGLEAVHKCGRLGLVKTIVQSAWKYRYFSEKGSLRSLAELVKGYVFERKPEV